MNNNARRRMVVQKFNNRPPFQAKLKENATAAGKNYKKTFENIEESYRTIMSHLNSIDDEEETMEEPEPHYPKNPARPKVIVNSSAIPKVLDRFQRAAPKRQPTVLRSNNPTRKIVKNDEKITKETALSSSEENDKFGLQTLYRNKNMDFGKNVSNHRTMKNLLQTYDEPLKEYSSVQKASHHRFDKATSTSDIPFDTRYHKTYRKPRGSKPRTVAKQHSHGSISKTSNPTPKPFLNSAIISSPSYVGSLSESAYAMDEEGDSSGNFAADQVKKMASKPNKIVARKTDNKMSTKLNARALKLKTNSKSKLRNNAGAKNYMEMMNAVKKKLPKLESNKELLSNDNKFEWSDEVEESKSAHQVKFPKETRCAVERMMENAKLAGSDSTRTPLTKYMKPKEMSIKPAISFNQKELTASKMAFAKNNSPYTVKMEASPMSRESGAVGDHAVSGANAGKVNMTNFD
ncbi:unnamed protein product, partial [Phyllotreta striolata]